MKGETKYSREVKGDRANHNKHVRFDITDGYVGISQGYEDTRWTDRVLLSPAQYRALLTFASSHSTT